MQEVLRMDRKSIELVMLGSTIYGASYLQKIKDAGVFSEADMNCVADLILTGGRQLAMQVINKNDTTMIEAFITAAKDHLKSEVR